MSSQSIALLPVDTRDTDGLRKSLQLTINKVNELAGVTIKPAPTKLSRLENPVVAAPVNKEQEALVAAVKDLEFSASHQSMPATNFDNISWSRVNGFIFDIVQGEDLGGTPPGVTVNTLVDYQVFVEINTRGAFWQRLQLIGNSQNRVFVRAGLDFDDALVNGWKEL